MKEAWELFSWWICYVAATSGTYHNRSYSDRDISLLSTIEAGNVALNDALEESEINWQPYQLA